jgi:hypothetical protein
MMKFAFKIFWTQSGRLELLLEPPPLDLQSIDSAHKLAKHFASYAPVSLIIIEAEDGSISELWFSGGRCQDIALAAG